MDRKKGLDFFTPQQGNTFTATLSDLFLRLPQELPLHQYILNNNEAEALTHIELYGNDNPPYIGNLNESAQVINLSTDFGYITIHGDNNRRYYRAKDNNSIFLQNKVVESALHLAIKQGMYKVAEALLLHGVPVNLIDGYGDTPLHIAAKMGNEDLIRLLIEWGASTVLQDRRTKALALELLNRDTIYSRETIELLSHPDPIETDPKNYKTTSLHDAILHDNSENKIKTLCQIIGNLIPNKDGERPSVLAKKLNRNPKIVSFLELLEICTSVKIQYNAHMLSIKHKKRNENDCDFLRISINLLKTLHSQFTIWINLDIKECKGSPSASSSLAKPIEAKEAKLTCAINFFNYNKDTLNSILELLASCIHNISFSLKDKTCNIFPWKNIRALRYLAFLYKKNDATATLILDRLLKY